MTQFPELPMFAGINAPCRVETDIADLEVVGTIPPDLDGAFYRVGADHQYPPRFHNDVPFNGDGMVTMFRIRNGRVSLKSRYVQTDRFKAERAAGKALFGRYRNRFTDDPSVAGMNRNLANTNVLIHHGVLLALREDSPPVALDPVTLETIGNWDFHGTLPGRTCSAHCKIDRVSGNLVGFGFDARGGDFSRECVYFEVSPEGKVVHHAWFELPYYEMQHDCGITADYICFPVVPIMGAGVEGLNKGLPYYGWDPEREIHLGVLPRFGSAGDMRWFQAPNQFTSHVMNAWNEGSKVSFDTCVAPGNLFPFFPEFGKPFDPTKSAVKLTRWTVDVASAGNDFESSTVLSEFIGEFPRTDDRFQMRQYRHGWLLGFGPVRNQLGHVDVVSGTTESWQAPDTLIVQEPCFIPRTKDAAEGDGWIIQAATNAVSMLTEVNLFEATAIANGPIATIKLPLRLKPAFHGSWADGSLIKPSGLR